MPMDDALYARSASSFVVRLVPGAIGYVPYPGAIRLRMTLAVKTACLDDGNMRTHGGNHSMSPARAPPPAPPEPHPRAPSAAVVRGGARYNARALAK